MVGRVKPAKMDVSTAMPKHVMNVHLATTRTISINVKPVLITVVNVMRKLV